MEYIIAFFKRIMRFVLETLFSKKTDLKEKNFVLSDGDILNTSDKKTFLVKEVS